MSFVYNRIIILVSVNMSLISTLMPSPLGDLYALSDDTHLLLLEFADSKELEKKISVIAKNAGIKISEIQDLDNPHKNHQIIDQLKKELSEYFD